MNKMIDFRLLGIAVVLIAIVSFAIGFTVGTSGGDPASGSTLVYSGSGEIWNPSSYDNSGLGITFDGNTVCFVDGSASCDNNIDWNGTDVVINAPN